MTCYLSYVHASITGQRSCRSQVIAAQHCGNDPIPIHFPDHSAVHKVDQTISVNCNPCREQTNKEHTQLNTTIQLIINTSTPRFQRENKKRQSSLWGSPDAAAAVHLKRTQLKKNMNKNILFIEPQSQPR